MSGYYSESHGYGLETDTPPVLGSDLFDKKKFMRNFAVNSVISETFALKFVSQNYGVECLL